MTASNTPSGFSANSNVTWCPHCAEPVHVQHRYLISYDEVEQACETHFRTRHHLRWWLWQRFGWRRAIRGF